MSYIRTRNSTIEISLMMNWRSASFSERTRTFFCGCVRTSKSIHLEYQAFCSYAMFCAGALNVITAVVSGARPHVQTFRATSHFGSQFLGTTFRYLTSAHNRASDSLSVSLSLFHCLSINGRFLHCVCVCTASRIKLESESYRHVPFARCMPLVLSSSLQQR